jgi:hypothetical protein
VFDIINRRYQDCANGDALMIAHRSYRKAARDSGQTLHDTRSSVSIGGGGSPSPSATRWRYRGSLKSSRQRWYDRTTQGAANDPHIRFRGLAKHQA